MTTRLSRAFSNPAKAELDWRRNWQTRHDVEAALFEYINGFCNPRGRHSALIWKRRVAFERKAALQAHLA